MRTTTEHGYAILQQAPHGRNHVVLAHRADHDLHPFVTWIMNDQGECWWGEYCQTLEEAVADFNDRAKRVRH